MLTACPGCETRFRITPEQLKLRHGKVRCGECRHVFNALETLVEEPAAVLPVAPPFMPEGESDERSFAPALETAAEAPEDPSQTPFPEPVRADTPVPAEVAPPPVVPLEPDLHEEAPAPPRRWPWLMASLLAVLFLCLQALIHFRVELAVLLPESRPALAALCDSLGCTIELPRNADMVSIESSDLHPDPARKKLLTLTATLKNRAPFAQTWPHLELTLTDVSDRPLARRVLAPADYLPKGTDIAAGFAPRREMTANVVIALEDLAASGYRLYLFYP